MANELLRVEGVSAGYGEAVVLNNVSLSLEEGKKAYIKAPGYQSLYGSTEIANNFNWYNKVYSLTQNVPSYIDPSFTNGK